MKIELQFSGRDGGMAADLKTTEGEKTTEAQLMLTMPEPTGDAEPDRLARLAKVREFFQSIGDKVWSEMSPDDFKEPDPKPE